MKTSSAAAGFRVMAEAIPEVAWIADPDGSTEYVNRPGIAFAGYRSRATPVWSSLLHLEDAADVRLGWDHAIATQTSYAVDCRLRRCDGQYRWHALRADPLRDRHGTLLGWFATATDIDDAKQLEAGLRSARRGASARLALLETLQSTAPIGFGFVDREFRLVVVNEVLAAVNGSTVQEQIGQSVAEVVPALWPQLQTLYQRVLESGQPVLDVDIEDPGSSGAASARHWMSSFYPVSLGAELVGVGVVAVDITERKNAEQAYRQVAAVVEYSGEATFGTTADGIITSWNAAATRLFGYGRAEIIGQPVSVLAPAALLDEQERIRARINAGSPVERMEAQGRRKDNSLVDVLITSAPVNDDAGTVVGRSVTVQDITDRLRGQLELQASQRRLAEAQQIAQVGSFEFDLVTGELTWSTEHYRILGLDPALTPSPELFIPLIHPDDDEVIGRAWTDATERGIGFDLVYRIIRPDGQQRWVHNRAVTEVAPNGSVVRLSGILRDTTDQIEASRAQRAADTRLEIGFEQAGIGAGILNLQGIPTRVNAAVCELLGRPEEQLINRTWDDYHHPDELPVRQAMQARGLADADTYADERRFLRPDGSIVWAALHVTRVRDETGEPQYYLAQLQDITERKRVEVELAHQALHDSLTGLANRALLSDRLVHGLAGTRRRGSHLGVIFLDVDHFKNVNDSLGHTAGDDLLRHAVNRISAVIRPSDTVARFGGDEFVIVCDDATIQETEKIAERVLDAIRQPCVISDQEMTVTASIGIVLADELATPESLLRDSDSAMYLAKSHGRNRIEFFDEDLRLRAERHLATASALRHALERDEFTVYYQPIIDLDTGAVVSAEALLRWQRPGHGLVSPTEFIPLAEETGLIIPIGAWVLEQACRELLEWQRSAPTMTIAVNLSVRQVLAADIVAQVDDVLTRSGLPFGSVCLELTESVFMGDAEYFTRTLTNIKALGVTLSIDDFGTGYSALSYLKRFPVDAVKIDKAFVDGLGTDPHDTALVAAIIAMADALDLGVTAEGIETPSQLAILKQLHCRRGQGYHFARPMPAAQMKQLLAGPRSWTVD